MRCFCFSTVIQGNSDWTATYSPSNACAVRGGGVAISCTYDYPDNVQYRPTTVPTLWFTKGGNYRLVDPLNDADYTGRVESSCGVRSWNGPRGDVKCTLRIKDLRQSDSALYKFTFTTNRPALEYTGNPGVMLSVTGKLG